MTNSRIIFFAFIACLALSSSTAIAAVANSTAVPIIGIYAMPSHSSSYATKDYQYVLGANIEWIEMSGAQTLLIPFDESKEYYQNLTTKINGILFTGGDLDISINSTIPYQPSGPNQWTANAALLV